MPGLNHHLFLKKTATAARLSPMTQRGKNQGRHFNFSGQVPCGCWESEHSISNASSVPSCSGQESQTLLAREASANQLLLLQQRPGTRGRRNHLGAGLAYVSLGHRAVGPSVQDAVLSFQTWHLVSAGDKVHQTTGKLLTFHVGFIHRTFGALRV